MYFLMNKKIFKKWLIAFSISFLSVSFFSKAFAQQTLEYDVEYVPPIVELIREGRQTFTIDTLDYTDPHFNDTDINTDVKYIPEYWIRGDFNEIYNAGYNLQKVNSFIDESTDLEVWTAEDWLRNYVTLWKDNNFVSNPIDFWLDQKTTSFVDFSIPTNIAVGENKLNLSYNANWKSLWIKPSWIYINGKKALHSINLFPTFQNISWNNEFHWRIKITQDRKNTSNNYSLGKQIDKNKIEWNWYWDNIEPLFSYITAKTESELNTQKNDWTYGFFDTRITQDNQSKGIVIKRTDSIMNDRGDLKLTIPTDFVQWKLTLNLKIDKAMDFKFLFNDINNNCETLYQNNEVVSCDSHTFLKYDNTNKKFIWNWTEEYQLSDITGEYRIHFVAVNNALDIMDINTVIEKKENGIFVPKTTFTITWQKKWLGNFHMLFDIPEKDVKYAELLSYSIDNGMDYQGYWLKIYDTESSTTIKTRTELEHALNVKNHKVVKTYNFGIDYKNKKEIWNSLDPNPIRLYKNNIINFNNRTEIYEYTTLINVNRPGGWYMSSSSFPDNINDIIIESPKRKIFVYINDVFIGENDLSDWTANALFVPRQKLKQGVNKISIFEIQDNSVTNYNPLKWNFKWGYYAFFIDNGNNYIEATPFFNFKEVGQTLNFANYNVGLTYNAPSTINQKSALYKIRAYAIKRANFANDGIRKQYYADLARNYQTDIYGNDLTEINIFNRKQLEENTSLKLSSSLDKDWFASNFIKKSSNDIPWNGYNTVTSWFTSSTPFEDNLVYTNGLLNKGGMLWLTTNDSNYYTFLAKSNNSQDDDIILFKWNININGDANPEFFMEQDNYLMIHNQKSDTFDIEDKLFYNTKFLSKIENAIQPFSFSLYNKKDHKTLITTNNITISSNLLENDYVNTFNTSPASYKGFSWLRVNKTLNTTHTDLKGNQLDKNLFYYKHFKLQ